MDISELTLKIIIVLIPGIISVLLIRYLTIHKPFSAFYFSIFSLIKGVIDYSFLEVIYFFMRQAASLCKTGSFNIAEYGFGKNLSVWRAFDNTLVSIPIGEILNASLLSIIPAALIIWIYNRKYLIKIFGNYLGWTNRGGDDDIWSIFFNFEEVVWVYLRIKDTGITYFGRVRAFSDPGEKQEIVLEDVSVYSTVNKTKLLYELKAVYIPLEHGNFTVEFPELEGD